MGFPIEQTPPSINIRLERTKTGIYVLRRRCLVWVRIRWFPGENEDAAVEFIEQEREFDKKLAQWAEQVKIHGRWVCAKCGDLDKRLLEAHHKKAKHSHPELALELDNGECLCIYCHALEHKVVPRIYEKIMARLGEVLYQRLKNPGPPKRGRGRPKKLTYYG